MNPMQPLSLAIRLALGASVISAAVAQENSGSTSRLALEEITVTATRRAEGVQDIPYNITAVTGDFLKDVGADDLTKMSQFIPGMQMIDNGARGTNLVTLRGMNVGGLEAAENQGGTDVISRYINDTPLLIDFKLNDVARVEVLRGPQGTLYGRGAMGGTLRYILNEPNSEEIEGEIGTKLYKNNESDDFSYQFNGVFNLPITDTLALRVSGSYLDDTGFVDYTNVLTEPGVSNNTREVEDVNDEQTLSLRVSLRWEPTDTFYGQLNYFHQDQETGGRQAVNEDFTGDKFSSALRYTEPYATENRLYNLEMNWDIRWVELFSSTSYSTFDETESRRDQTDLLCVDIYPGYCDFPEFSGFTDDSEEKDVFVQELRILSTADSAPAWMDWILGFYYEDEDTENSDKEFTPGYQDYAGIDTGYGELEYWNYGNQTFEEKAVFGEMTFRPIEPWQITVGVRYFEQEQVIKEDCTLLAIFWFYTQPPATPECESGKSNIDDTVTKFNTSYNFTEDFMVYLTRAEGFRRGGTNVGPQLTSEEKSFTSDEVTNYEIGWRATLADGQWIFNGAIFRIDWEDLQVPAKSEAQAINIIGNASEGRIEGLELSAQGMITENLQLSGWATYYDHELVEDAPEIGGFDGDAFPGVPDIQANLAFDYGIPLDASEVIIRGNVYYKDEVNTRLNSLGTNNDNETLDSYTILNMSVTYQVLEWSASLYVDNLTDEYYFSGGRGKARYGERGQFHYVGQPRTVGVEATYHF
ncbi:TonB-dependent receptor [Aestuariicella hydrocarbonica]|uniref:TonB-dependent receptor n=1 Tax=Pseudomaricurvus hydrocarbonicus TaxID=1470433 RepID=A0A9E5MP87_9GAMM|nr:TonB-dependent receptor [Aestuariicella hydrocarbonica]NHO67911.1 TonB-dependent receptor [Aestuariicella hydrocarbonica]